MGIAKNYVVVYRADTVDLQYLHLISATLEGMESDPEPEPSAYLLASWLNNRGYCQCGWAGKRRLLHGSAVLDVLDHCAGTGHVPTSIPPITFGHSRSRSRGRSAS